MSATAFAVRALRQYALRRRFRGMKSLPSLAIAAVPVFVAAVMIWVGENSYENYGRFIVPMAIYFVLPFVAMLTVLPLIGELYDNDAIGYLYTRPAPRWAPLLGIYQGALLAMLPPLLIAALIPGLALMITGAGGSTGDWLMRMGGLSAILVLGGIAYGAICLFFAVWSRRAIIWSIFALFGWGVVFGGLPGNIRRTSPHQYLIGLSREWCDVENAFGGMFLPDPDPPGVTTSLIVLGIGSIVFILLAARAAKRRDVH